MTAAEWAVPIIQAITAGIGVAITALIGIYVPRMVAAFETRTHIQLTTQQQATVLAAATTAAGILQTQLDQGILKIGGISVHSPAVQAEAIAAVARVPEASAALDKSVDSMAATITGLVDTAHKTMVLAAAVPPAPPPFPLIPKVTLT